MKIVKTSVRILYEIVFQIHIVVIRLAIAGLPILCGCQSTRYLPVENEKWHTDTVVRYVGATDSVIVVERFYEGERRYDSVAPILDSLHRVIGWDRYHFREVTKMSQAERTRLMALIDSLRAVSADTVRIQVPYPVERRLSKWEQVRLDFGGYAITALAVVVCVAVAWLVFIKRIRLKR